MALAVIAAAAGALTLAAPQLFHDPPVTVGNARGTGAVVLLVGVPVLVLGLLAARRGRWQGHVLWLGGAGYLAYNAVLFTFIAAFNSLFLLYVAMLSLAVWALVATVRELDVPALAARFPARLPRRLLAGYLLACAILFAFAWLSDIVPATLTNTRPASYRGTLVLTNPVHVLDLAFTLPLMVVAAVWLWRGRAWGYVLGGTLVVALTIETISIGTDQLFGHLHDPAAPLDAVPLMAVLSALGIGASLLMLRGGGRGSVAAAPDARMA